MFRSLEKTVSYSVPKMCYLGLDKKNTIIATKMRVKKKNFSESQSSLLRPTEIK